MTLRGADVHRNLTAFLFICAAPPLVLAHHSAAMFDKSRELSLQGTVKEFRFTNPHTWIYLLVKNADGVDEQWELEGGSLTHMVRNGWTNKSIKAGEKITVKVYRRKDGALSGEYHDVVTEDGRILTFSPVGN